MNYINPIEILELEERDTDSLDSTLIKKSKKKLFANIELSNDGYYDYQGRKLTKSDCIKAIDELEDKNKVQFYKHLVQNSPLNNFLANGSSELLNSFQQHSIYKLPEFVKFVSPYFAEKLNGVLLKAFRENNVKLLSAALRTDQLLTKKN